VSGDRQASRFQDLERRPDSHARDAVVLGQLRLGRKPVAWPEPAAVDQLAEMGSDLNVRGPLVARPQVP